MLFRSNDTATTEIYTVSDTLSLHDALPISARCRVEVADTDLGGVVYYGRYAHQYLGRPTRMPAAMNEAIAAFEGIEAGA